MKDHVFAQLKERPSAALMSAAAGIGPYLSDSEYFSLALALSRMAFGNPSSTDAQAASRLLSDLYDAGKDPGKAQVHKALNFWESWFVEKGQTEDAARVVDLRESLEVDVPF